MGLIVLLVTKDTRWFKYDRDYLCVNKPVTVPVIFEPPCTFKKQFNVSDGEGTDGISSRR